MKFDFEIRNISQQKLEIRNISNRSLFLGHFMPSLYRPSIRLAHEALVIPGC
jgi:hypothetical protein